MNPPTPLADLRTPALLVDADRIEHNIRSMAALAREAQVALRPHWKTHKCVEIARAQIDAGAIGGTVAKPDEAQAFFAQGFRDVLIATPVVDPAKVDDLIGKVREYAWAKPPRKLTVLVESATGVDLWQARAQAAGVPVSVMLEVDVGMRRTGVSPGEAALPLARRVREASHLRLEGVMTHAGHGYASSSAEELEVIGRQEGEQLVKTAEVLRANEIPCDVVSVGSTPTVAHAARVPGVTEIRPGNYVFHDRIQVALGVAGAEECALSVLAMVVARPAPDRLVIDAGAKTLTTDQGKGARAPQGFGALFDAPNRILTGLSEEHGIVTVEPSDPYQVGDRVRVAINHACVVANLHRWFYVVRNDTAFKQWWIIARGAVQ